MTSNSLSKEQVLERAEQLDFPSSVVEFFQGYLGQPVGGFPEPLRSKVIRNKPRIDGRPGATMDPLDFKKIKAELRSKFGKHITDVDVSSYVMYPKVCISRLTKKKSMPRFWTGLRRVSRIYREIWGSEASPVTQHQHVVTFLTLRSVIPTRYFLGRPETGEEMHISIEKGKTLIIRLMAVGPVVEGRAQRDVWFEVNGEVDPDLCHITTSVP